MRCRICFTVVLDLSDNKLVGTISPLISNLKHLSKYALACRAGVLCCSGTVPFAYARAILSITCSETRIAS